MRFFFADDSRQRNPTRAGMGPLVAIGGVSVPCERVRALEAALDGACDSCGFPNGQEFKWSPARDQWMRTNLVAEKRQEFWKLVLTTAAAHDVKVFVVIEDTNCQTATGAQTPEEDLTKLFLERVQNDLTVCGDDGIVIVDRSNSSGADEVKFLEGCLQALETGTKYVKKHDRIGLNVLSSPSHLVRLLQLADVVTGCTLSTVAGESMYAPPVFEFVKPMLCKQSGRIGGVGLKLHPHNKYLNLYHWLVGDKDFVRGLNGWSLPVKGHMYVRSADSTSREIEPLLLPPPVSPEAEVPSASAAPDLEPPV